MLRPEYDVIVVGAGNAAFSAAHAAREEVDRVLVLEKAPREWMGGNSYFTAGAFRTVHHGLDELLPVLPAVSEEERTSIVLEPYTRQEFRDDLDRLSRGRCDKELTNILINESTDTIHWLHRKGLRFKLLYERQSFKVDDKQVFWGGLVIGTVDQGPGMIRQHFEAAINNGIEVRFESPVVRILQNQNGGVSGVSIRTVQGIQEIGAKTVVLAAGGFEANPRMRSAYLGPGWDLAKVRGTPYNTGEVLQMALSIGAQSFGNWSGCHSIAWDAAAPSTGDRTLTHRLSRQSYPFGIVVNENGERFLDEGADFRNYTYAKYGAEILKQPNAIAYQIFDGKIESLLAKEYTIPGVSRYKATTMAELARKLELEPELLERTIDEFNSAVRPGNFNPTIKDGKQTEGIYPPKSNWALPIDTPPFFAFKVTCGITFTYGGLQVDIDARVLDLSNKPIPGLFGCGELVGGLFYHNYPGGSGLMAGAVFGRRAGKSAARRR